MEEGDWGGDGIGKEAGWREGWRQGMGRLRVKKGCMVNAPTTMRVEGMPLATSAAMRELK